MRLILMLVSICTSIQLTFSQENRYTISGFVIDSLENDFLPFATIYKTKTNEATITNENGYFEFAIDSEHDSLFVSYLGYKTKLILLEKNKKSYTVILEKNILELEEVTIRPKNYSYILDLIENCRANQSQEKVKGKAYYQLKSYLDNKQIELVENYYNATIKGYNLLAFNSKAGRVGLRREDGLFFGSLETSKAIVRYKLFTPVKWFPKSPMHMSKKGIQKNFYIDIVKEYVENKDTIVKVLLYPKKNKEKYFTTTLLINKSDNNFQKVELSGKDLDKFPLEPLYEGDRLYNKSLKIVKTFKNIKEKMYLEHVHFNYDFLYRKKGSTPRKVYSKAIVQIYNYTNQFELPVFGSLNSNMNDYQLPYNQFFWENNKELKLNDELDTNKLFMNSEQTVTNVDSNVKSELSDFFNYKIYRWSKQRMKIEKLPQNTDYQEGQEMTRFKTKIFLDLNYFEDSLHVYSVALFDSYQSYFFYKIDTKVLCFINMYFDLVEIARRELQLKLNNGDLSKDLVYQEYDRCNKLLNEKSRLFLEETLKGSNVSGMKKWNEEILKELNIDNLKIYQLYQSNDEE